MSNLNHATKILSGLMLIALLAGCAGGNVVGPRAQMLNPNDLNGGAAIAKTATATGQWPTAKWWEVFDDAQLNSLVDQAVKNNATLKIARARVEEARGIASIVHASTLPQAGAEVSSERVRYTEQQFIPPPYAGNFAYDNSAFVKASYDLDFWGKDKHAEEGATANPHASEAEAQEARLVLQTLVTRVYVNLALAYELRRLEQQNLERQMKMVEIAKKRHEIGIATQLELSQVEAPVPSVRAKIEQIDAQIDSLRRQLAALIGQGPGAGDAIQPPHLQPVHEITLPSQLPADLVGRRPDIVANRWRVEAASQGIDVARAQFYPNVNLSAFIGFESLGFTGFLSKSSLMEGVMPAVSLPIFEGGRLRGNLNRQSAVYDEAVERYNESVIDAMRAVADQVADWRSLNKQQEQTQEGLNLNQRTYELAVRGYRSGLTDYINVLTAEVSLINQQQADARVRYAELTVYADLIRAIGGGFDETSARTDNAPGATEPVAKAGGL